LDQPTGQTKEFFWTWIGRDVTGVAGNASRQCLNENGQVVFIPAPKNNSPGAPELSRLRKQASVHTLTNILMTGNQLSDEGKK